MMTNPLKADRDAAQGGSEKNGLAGVSAIDILLVEDNEDHAVLTADALRTAYADVVTTRVHVAADGDAAIAFLHRQGQYAAAPRPDLILLDLRLSNRDGFEVLRAIKEDPVLRVIPTVILTTSDAEEDVVKSYRLGANEYITKPVSAAEYIAKVQAIPRYWVRFSAVPPKG